MANSKAEKGKASFLGMKDKKRKEEKREKEKEEEEREQEQKPGCHQLADTRKSES